MIGSKVVGTVGWTLSLSLITKGKKKLLGLSVILSPWGRPNQKKKLTTGLQYTALSLPIFFSFLLFCIKEKNCWVVSNLSINHHQTFFSVLE